MEEKGNFQAFKRGSTKQSDRMSAQEKLNEKIKNTFEPYIGERFRIKIADIQFAFANQDLIKMLTSRGKAIVEMKFNKVE
jgi:hypothetical protein